MTPILMTVHREEEPATQAGAVWLRWGFGILSVWSVASFGFVINMSNTLAEVRAELHDAVVQEAQIMTSIAQLRDSLMVQINDEREFNRKRWEIIEEELRDQRTGKGR
jgi:hypothetical protein